MSESRKVVVVDIESGGHVVHKTIEITDPEMLRQIVESEKSLPFSISSKPLRAPDLKDVEARVTLDYETSRDPSIREMWDAAEYTTKLRSGFDVADHINREYIRKASPATGVTRGSSHTPKKPRNQKGRKR